MDIQNLVPVDYSNQRVLLSSQVAEVYNCPRERIKKNFQNNREHFKEGVHYFKLEGASLQAFKNSDTGKNFPGLEKAAILYLWTRRGVARHCKSINTDKAWDAFEELEDFYFANKPVETPLADEEPVKKVRKPLPEYAVVYAARLSNNLVKIGITCDFNRRIKEVRKETGLDVEEVFTTGNQPLDDARKLESTVKAKFHDKCKGGELYNVPFAEVKAALTEDVKATLADKLLDIADRLNGDEVHDKILLHAANLLCEKNIF